MNLKSTLAGLFGMIALTLSAFGQIQTKQAITITVNGVPSEEKGRIDGVYPVAENGTVNMPFIGTLKAAGLLPEVLAANLQERYKSAQIYRQPTFQVLSSASDTVVQEVVHVGGEVKNPGPVPFNRNLTLYQAIQAARGATEFGSMYRVTLFRNGTSREYDLKRDAKAMNVALQPNDTIEVPQKGILGH